jgi:hypothetical protein
MKTSLNDLIEILNNAKEAEDLLNELINTIGIYELRQLLNNSNNHELCSKIEIFRKFDDSE